MKVVILAGGYGTRISEETDIKPKPMVEIGGRPILWHIMKYYSSFGFKDFVVCLGYKGYLIKEYFYNYYLHQANVTVDLKSNVKLIHNTNSEDWKVTLVDTGKETLTAGRIKRIKDYLDDETFMLTYGDGLSDVDISKLIESHQSSSALVTVTATKPQGRFGIMQIDDNSVVKSFFEKRVSDSGWINGGYFVCEPEIFDYIEDDYQMWEDAPLTKICSETKLNAYKHDGFWHAMDTIKDKIDLNKLWDSGKAPWKVN
jgi:glucose-1-phosphate cytidylyltransferase